MRQSKGKSAFAEDYTDDAAYRYGEGQEAGQIEVNNERYSPKTLGSVRVLRWLRFPSLTS